MYYEVFQDAAGAIFGDMQIKAGSRKDKARLIDQMNPASKDLSEDL